MDIFLRKAWKYGILLLVSVGLYGCSGKQSASEIAKKESLKAGEVKAAVQMNDASFRENWPAEPNAQLEQLMKNVKKIKCHYLMGYFHQKKCKEFYVNHPDGPVHEKQFRIIEVKRKWYLYFPHK